MTNNQRAFQRELNRLQKSISNLQKKGYVKNVDLPDIPKRVTTKAIEELKLQRGKNYVVKTPTITTPSSKGSKAFTSKSSSTYVHKPRESQTKDELNAKRREWYARNRETILNKKAQWREANREKVHESSKKSYQKHRDEILAKGKTKRERAKNTATGDTYTPEYDMVEWLLNRINQARADFADRFDDWQARHGYSARIPEQFYRRASLLNELYNLVSTVEKISVFLHIIEQ